MGFLSIVPITGNPLSFAAKLLKASPTENVIYVIIASILSILFMIYFN
ncbi:hypothetical protein D6_00160 [Faustovirus]|nr:hypothetical protein D6_00160 [Faustovirus]AMP44292.1 hypothetical protein PRJ_Dakar_00339 [Faustovirus]